MKSTPTGERSGIGVGLNLGGGCEGGCGRGAGWEAGDGSKLAEMEHGSPVARRSVRVPLEGRRDLRSSRRIAPGAGEGGGATDEDEESLNRHFSLETPLQQVREHRRVYVGAETREMIRGHRCGIDTLLYGSPEVRYCILGFVSVLHVVRCGVARKRLFIPELDVRYASSGLDKSKDYTTSIGATEGQTGSGCTAAWGAHLFFYLVHRKSEHDLWQYTVLARGVLKAECFRRTD